MTIFDRIKQKASQALQGAGNFIDRDKSMSGVQLAQGGLTNRIGGFFNDAYNNRPTAPQNYQGSNLQRNIQGTSNFLDKVNQSPLGNPARFLFGDDVTDTGAPQEQNPGFLRAAFTRPFAEIPLSVSELLGGTNKVQQQDPAGKVLFGNKPLQSYQESARTGGVDFLTEDLGFSQQRAEDLVPLMAVAGVALDLTPPGVEDVGRKGVTELLPSAAKSVDDVVDVVKGSGAVDDVIDYGKAAKDISNTRIKDRNIVSKSWDYLMTQTPERLKKVFGDQFYGKYLDPTITNLNNASKQSDDFIKEKLTNIGSVADSLNIRPGTDESKLLYTLRDDGFDAVASQVGRQRAEEIQALYDAMRKSYDEVYDAAAPIAEKLGKVLPKKENFLSQQGNKALGFNIDLTSGKTITDEASASLFKQQGDLKNVDPLEAYILYMNKAANLLFMEPEAAKIADLAKNISFNKNTTPDQLSELNTLVKKITGQGQEFSTVRKLFDDYFGTTKTAAVVGKGSTLINQILGVPGAIGNTGFRNFIEGNLDPATRQIVKEKSSLFSSVNKSIPKSLRGTKIHQRIFQGMADALQNANKMGYELSLRGFVKQAEKAGLDPKNIDEIVSMADKEAARVLGDRRSWMQPQFYDTFLGKVLAPFTTEQTAQAASFLQNIGEKKAGAVIRTLISWKIGNEIWDRVAGFSPYFDPAQAAQDTVELWNGSDTKEQDKVKAFMRLVEEALTLAPPVQSMVNQGYSAGETLGFLPDSRDVFANDRTWMSTGSLLNPFSNITIDFDGEEGEKWLPRNITGNKVADTTLNIGAKYIPGLEQVNRTVQSLNTMGRGYAESRKGKPMYEAPDNLFEKGKALIFGQNSTKNAQEMFDNDFDWGLKDKQAEIFDQITDTKDKLEFLKESREKNTNEKRLDSFLGRGESGDFSSDEIGSVVFDGKSATSDSIQERMDVYKELNKIMTDETLPESYKQQVIEASGADPKEVEYYTNANKDVDVKLQDVVLPKLDAMADDEDVMEYLGSMRRVVGGKQMLTSTMIDYLYERDYISKNQKEALKALKYDEIKNEFYYKKSYKGGDKNLTYKQALKAFNIDLPKFSSLKSIDLALDIGTGTSQTDRSGDKLLSSILSSAPKQPSSRGDRKLWFNQ